MTELVNPAGTEPKNEGAGSADNTIPSDLALPTAEELGLDVSPESIPQVQDQFVQQYLSGRDSFLDREEATRSDYSFRQSLSPLAREACDIVSRIRAHEQKTIWAPAAGSNSDVYPGMPLSLAIAKRRAEESELWKVVKRMPKGCLLHSHFDAMIDNSWLVEQALKTPGMGFYSDKPLVDDEALETAKFGFRYIGEAAVAARNNTPSLHSSDYKAGDILPATRAHAEFKSTKYESFQLWIKHRSTITADEALSPHIDNEAIWTKFSSCFTIYNTILGYEPIFRAALQRLFTELSADGIRWAEFRYCFLTDFYREGHTEPDKDYINFFIAFDQELGRFQDRPEGQKFWGARFIWTSIRSPGRDNIQLSMTNCIRHKAMFPHLIAAYDLVGHEDKGQTLLELLPLLFWFRKAQAMAQLNIPFVFHAAETIETGTDTTRNLYDAVLLGTRRIGHGLALYKHPLLIETVKSKNICIESCPLSNEILRLTSSVMAHPLPALIAKGVKCTISNDDPAILGGPDSHGRNGTSRDMWSILQGWEDLGLAGLGSLAIESVRFALFEVPETVDETPKEWNEGVKKGLNGTGIRADRMREWRHEWDEFIEWVLKEYAAEWGGDENKE